MWLRVANKRKILIYGLNYIIIFSDHRSPETINDHDILLINLSDLLKIFHPDVVLPLDVQSRMSLKSKYNFI